jgi:DNA-binding cell septation regulator SpoVG
MSNNTIEVTDVRVRLINSNHLLAIASVTLNNELIINDIKVNNENGNLRIKLPNSEFAKNNNQYSIIPQNDLFQKIKSAIIKEIVKVNSN